MGCCGCYKPNRNHEPMESGNSNVQRIQELVYKNYYDRKSANPELDRREEFLLARVFMDSKGKLIDLTNIPFSQEFKEIVKVAP